MNTVDVKERPIIFSGASVRAILDSRKVQTRRVVKLDAELRKRGCKTLEGAWVDPGFGDGEYLKVPGPDESAHRLYCPHGYKGDRLWVRENYDFGISSNPDDHGQVAFRFGGDNRDGLHPDSPKDSRGWARTWKQRSSMFMPRWASRLTLEITNIRVERLQDISRIDCLAEGIETPPLPDDASIESSTAWLRMQYHELWNSINAKRGFAWDTNPLVWVIEFRKQP